MLGRYLGIALMTLLVCLWVAGAAYGFILLSGTTRSAGGVQLATQSVRRDLEATEIGEANRRIFPEGQIAGVIQSSWSTSLPVRAFPRGLSTESTARREHARPTR